MGEKPEERSVYDVDHMMPGEPKEINAGTDNDMLAGIIPDPRLPVPPKGGSIDYDREKDEPGSSDQRLVP